MTTTEIETLLLDIEKFQLSSIVKSTLNIFGDFAEVGTYKGGSAKIICELKGDKTFHIFDTFKGLPNPSSKDCQEFYSGKFQSSLEEVEKNLGSFKNIIFYEGLFQERCALINNKVFSFVHIDGDLCETIFSSLNFFYTKMNKGGAILVHDYSCKEVKGCVDDFLNNKMHSAIDLSMLCREKTNYCLIKF